MLQQASNLQRPLNVKMRRFINYVKESYAELTRKVTWPTWDKLQNSAIVVMVASVIFAVVIFAIDFCFQHLMSAIYTL
jgi:preprotein translocase subunit SecE